MPGSNISAMIMHKTKSRVVVLVGGVSGMLHSYLILRYECNMPLRVYVTFDIVTFFDIIYLLLFEFIGNTMILSKLGRCGVLRVYKSIAN